MGSVPDTNTFSLQDVVDVVNPSIHTLQHSFDESIPEYFDPTYEGNKDRLSNFRNYTIPSITYDANFKVGDGTSWLQNAYVNVLGGGSGYTDSNGDVTIENLEDGTYDYSVSKSGYSTEYGSFTIDGGNTSVTVTLNEE